MERQKLKYRLAEAMEIRGIRAVDLIDLTGIPKVTISYYMNGKTEPRANNLYLIAQALDVSEAWLLGYDVAMHRTPEQKKNDQLARLVARIRDDADFFEAVSALDRLSGSKYQTVKRLLMDLQE